MTPAVVVDVGNTRIKWGRCGPAAIIDIVRLDTNVANWQRQLEAWSLPAGALWCLAGVHPQHRDMLADWLQKLHFRTHVLHSFQQLPLDVRVDAPERVGIDRLLNAVAANAVRRPDEPVVIVDAGSAVTVDLVDANGAFRGGAIFPGLRLMAEALHRYTAQLPLIEVRGAVPYPGASTEKAMTAGILNAVAGGIERLTRQSASSSRMFLTGGDAELLSRVIKPDVEVWPEMTLEGILASVAALVSLSEFP